jgi:hypothetical protein
MNFLEGITVFAKGSQYNMQDADFKTALDLEQWELF